MSTQHGQVRVGTSGYQYDHWRGIFYPEAIPKAHWFEYYATHFDSVEINNTFYHLPAIHTFDDWRDRAPDDFCYALKFSRYGSHLKKLMTPEATIGEFMKRAGRLGDRLGPILVQLPPHWRADVERLRAFLQAAPSDQRWAFEFRDPAWLCDAIYDVLRESNAALCVHDLIDDHPRTITADWLYIRFHGVDAAAPYSGNYPYQALSAWARWLKPHIENGHDTYVYFNNDAEGYAVANARDLKRYLVE